MLQSQTADSTQSENIGQVDVNYTCVKSLISSSEHIVEAAVAQDVEQVVYL